MKPRFCLRTLLLLALLGLNFGAASIASAATGSASPTQEASGARVHFSAAGCSPGERIDFWVSSPSGRTQPRYASVIADASGAVIWSLPSGVSPQPAVLRARPSPSVRAALLPAKWSARG